MKWLVLLVTFTVFTSASAQALTFSKLKDNDFLPNLYETDSWTVYGSALEFKPKTELEVLVGGKRLFTIKTNPDRTFSFKLVQQNVPPASDQIVSVRLLSDKSKFASVRVICCAEKNVAAFGKVLPGKPATIEVSKPGFAINGASMRLDNKAIGKTDNVLIAPEFQRGDEGLSEIGPGVTFTVDESVDLDHVTFRIPLCWKPMNANVNIGLDRPKDCAKPGQLVKKPEIGILVINPGDRTIIEPTTVTDTWVEFRVPKLERYVDSFVPVRK
ncbi:MAG: hypothetical protein EOP06_15725 [Proteobacteria bacterium]|nr:MAG: hypothetical protein EOP06_15725 [Pseudomonadota bacterium]